MQSILYLDTKISLIQWPKILQCKWKFLWPNTSSNSSVFCVQLEYNFFAKLKQMGLTLNKRNTYKLSVFICWINSKRYCMLTWIPSVTWTDWFFDLSEDMTVVKEKNMFGAHVWNMHLQCQKWDIKQKSHSITACINTLVYRSHLQCWCSWKRGSGLSSAMGTVRMFYL